MARMRTWLWSLCLCALCSCSLIRNSPRYDLANGYYTSTQPKASSKVYVHNNGDTIYLYSTQASDLKAGSLQKALPPLAADSSPAEIHVHLRQPSLDIDFLTIPLKYRFQLPDFPRQFTTSLNGAGYVGYRTDVYHVHYKPHPVGSATREVSHYGFSVGGFTGLGATAMNPWVTRDAITIEYDGMVWARGIAGIVAVNSFTAGVALGWDHLLDANRKTWIYQNKPWLGVVFGLNLN